MGSLFGGDDHSSQIRDLMVQNRALYDGLELPEYAEYNPELYDNETANYELTSEDPALRSKQLEALSQFDDLANDGLSDIDKAAFAEAKQVADSQAKARTAAAMQDAQARGVAGGGLEFAMRESGNQGAAQRANEAAIQQAAASAANRQKALEAYANQAGNIRSQDYGVNKGNTDVINQFNQLNTQNRNATNANNVNAKNSAFQYNQGMQTQDYNNRLGKINGQTGANQGIANAHAAAGASNQATENQLIQLAGAGASALLGRK